MTENKDEKQFLTASRENEPVINVECSADQLAEPVLSLEKWLRHGLPDDRRVRL